MLGRGTSGGGGALSSFIELEEIDIDHKKTKIRHQGKTQIVITCVMRSRSQNRSQVYNVRSSVLPSIDLESSHEKERLSYISMVHREARVRSRMRPIQTPLTPPSSRQ